MHINPAQKSGFLEALKRTMRPEDDELNNL